MGKVPHTPEEKEEESYLDGKITLIKQGGENLQGIRGRRAGFFFPPRFNILQTSA